MEDLAEDFKALKEFKQKQRYKNKKQSTQLLKDAETEFDITISLHHGDFILCDNYLKKEDD